MADVISVSDLNHYVKTLLDVNDGLFDLALRGEIANFVQNARSGHCYFSLRDDACSVKAVMFRTDARRLAFRPEEGMRVVVRCRATLYERDGAFQVYVNEMFPDGLCAAQLALEQLKARLEKAGFRVKVDDSDNSMGWKCAEYEMKGVPLRVECGPRDLENGQCILVHRNDGEKTVIKLEDLEQAVEAQLELVQKGMYEKAKKNLEEHIFEAHSIEEAKELQQKNGGFIKTMWCGDEACELKMKEVAGMSSRCMPLKQEHLGDTCACCGKPAKHMIYWGVAY